MATYYTEKTGLDRYDLRQTRYRSQRSTGKEHPHDLMAVSFPAAGMLELIKKHFPDTDASAITEEPAK
jgi:hypothetical protein